jgi:AcrR family transcriptional regulator
MGVNPALQALRRPQIVEAALKVIAEHGIQNTTLDLVANEAGMSKGGIVHYFSTKDELIKEAMVAFYGGIFKRGRETRDQFSHPLDKLLSFTWLYNRDDPDMFLGYGILYDFMAQASRNEDFSRAFHDWVDNWIALLQEAIEEGVAMGAFTVSDPESIAKTVSAIYQGIATRWYLAGNSHSTEWAVSSLKRAVTLLLTCE